MALEKLICPQCGGNDLKEIGTLLYKCNFCGGTFRDEENKTEIKTDHRSAALNTDLRQTYRRTDILREIEEEEEDSKTRSYIALLVIVGILLLTGLIVGSKACSEQKHIEQDMTNWDSIAKASIDQTMADIGLSADDAVPDTISLSYTENGLKVKGVSTLVNGNEMPLIFLQFGDTVTIQLEKPSGFTEKNKMIFISSSYSVTDKNGIQLFNSPQTDHAADGKGEPRSNVKQKMELYIVLDTSNGFTRNGNYRIRFNVTDKLNSNSISGIVPVHISDH